MAAALIACVTEDFWPVNYGADTTVILSLKVTEKNIYCLILFVY